jgi:hypothetical protein
MDYQKVLPALAVVLGVTAGAAQSFADDNANLFGMSESGISGVLVAREKGCLAEKGCVGICAGRKTLKKDGDKDEEQKDDNKGSDDNKAGDNKDCNGSMSQVGDNCCASKR